MCNMNIGVIYNLQGGPEENYCMVSSSLFSCSSSAQVRHTLVGFCTLPWRQLLGCCSLRSFLVSDYFIGYFLPFWGKPLYPCDYLNLSLY